MIPEIQWKHGDDLCDCTFQRIGWWTNPYLGKTMEFRMCCAWDALMKLHPELGAFQREIPAFDNYNTGLYETEPVEWNGASDMPRALWHRQLASITGRPVADVRAETEHLEAPKGKPRLRAEGSLIDFLRKEAAGIDIEITDVSNHNVQTST